jgi:hypothetical protein
MIVPPWPGYGISSPRCQLGITELPKSRNPGLFGSQNRLSGQLHHKPTRNTPPYQPASHPRFRKRMEGWSQMLKHLTGKPADYPISYWRMRFGGFKSVAPPQNVRMDIFGIKNPAKKGARVIHRSWSIAWRTTNEEQLSRALGG